MTNSMKAVHVIGAGLAGCEAAWQLAQRGIPVILHEKRPQISSPAHHTNYFAELVCSNSFRSDELSNAVGLLKQEMRNLGSIILQKADECRVPAGSALVVDRNAYAKSVTQEISNHPLIQIKQENITEIPEGPCIVATGPLTDNDFASKIHEKLRTQALYFFDAAAPIVTAESLDMEKIFLANRYGGTGEYLNCPMSKEVYDHFIDALLNAEEVPFHAFEDSKVFEGCMPVEVMARRGRETLCHGPLKPVGLIDPKTGSRPYAVVQLRPENKEGTLFNLVGFQTHLKFPEQKRVFGLIPGLENADFARYGVMHRNTYFHAPTALSKCYQSLFDPTFFLAGQITGVEGYTESASSGMVAGISLACVLHNKPIPEFSQLTMMGALGHYISTYSGKDFQPMNASFGILEPMKKRISDKRNRYLALSNRSLLYIEGLKNLTT